MTNLPPPFKIYDEAGRTIFGTAPKLELLLENPNCPFAHEAGVFIPEHNTLFITSNQYDHPTTQKRHIHISRITLPKDTHTTEATCTEIETNNVPLPNGGVNYKDGVLFCAQGTLDQPGGLAYMPVPTKDHNGPYESHMLISSFYGRDFNSPNDVVVHSDGSMWFTDPIYGWEQGVRPRPQLPNQVYRFDPKTKGVRAVADGFGRPNGICFSPDEKIVYVTDTDWMHGDGSTEEMRVSHM